jgi:hypothetical protein
LGTTPTHQRNRTSAEGKSRPEGLPTKRGSLSKVSIWGKPWSRKNWATTSVPRFGIEIATHLVVQPNRGTSVDKVGNLDHMPPLALGISRHEAFIFQIELDFLAWLAKFERFGLASMILFDAARLAQDLPDRGL